MAQICRVVSYAIAFLCNRISCRDVLSEVPSLSPSSLTSEIPVTSDSCCTTCNAVHFQSVDKTTRTKAIQERKTREFTTGSALGYNSFVLKKLVFRCLTRVGISLKKIKKIFTLL